MPSTSHSSALLTDLYELTMAAAYFQNDLHSDIASFELFVRDLPKQRGYLLAAGLEQALDFLEHVRFSSQEIDFVQSHPAFGEVAPAFFDYLKDFRFTGEVWAVPEGTPVFRDEPLLRVTAPIIEAQVVETYLLTAITFQTLIATKAARVVEAAQGRGVVEFGSRRAHGPEAGILAARATYIGGCRGTSNVAAGMRYGIPTYGTLAHSFVMAYEDEAESFRQFERVFPHHAILLVDTYDTLAAIDKIINAGMRPQGVRLDSGNLVELAKQVRERLDAAGLQETRILASGDLSEYAIAEIVTQGAPIDFFGVGTELATSRDAPALGGVYKLVEVLKDGQQHYRAKFSEDKVTYPGRKQVFRFRDPSGSFHHDVLARAEEDMKGADALLECMMREGRRTTATAPLLQARERARESLARLPESCRRLQDPAAYPVQISPALERLLEDVRQKILQPVDKHSRL
jgi:nicotinate phosphoribosyltransferase